MASGRICLSALLICRSFIYIIARVLRIRMRKVERDETLPLHAGDCVHTRWQAVSLSGISELFLHRCDERIAASSAICTSLRHSTLRCQANRKPYHNCRCEAASAAWLRRGRDVPESWHNRYLVLITLHSKTEILLEKSIFVMTIHSQCSSVILPFFLLEFSFYVFTPFHIFCKKSDKPWTYKCVEILLDLNGWIKETRRVDKMCVQFNNASSIKLMLAAERSLVSRPERS